MTYLSKLTPRHWKLYNLLSTNPDKWFTQQEICSVIDDYTYTDDTRNHCVLIGKDRVELNESPDIERIIVTKKHCFKIATYDEYIEERNSHIRKLKGQVAQLQAMDSKFDRDGQLNLLNDLYYETFESENENENEEGEN